MTVNATAITKKTYAISKTGIITVHGQKGKQTMTEYIVNPEEEHNLFYGRKYEELVRCMDCKHWYKGLNINYCRIFYDDNLKLYQSRPDDYCSRAERKTE
jgi:hypothetical protein